MSCKSIIINHFPTFLRALFDRIENSQILHRIFHGAFWSMSGAMVSRLLTLSASIFVARILTRNIYGELGMIRSTLSMFIIFAGFSMGTTATKHVAEFRNTDPERAGRIMSIAGLFTMASGTIMTSGLIIFAPWIANHSINAPHLITELRIGAFVLLISALNGAQTGALSGFEAFKAIAKINFWVGTTSFPLFVFGAYFGGLRGSVLALGGSAAINWLLNHFALRKVAAKAHVPFSFKGCTQEWPIVLRFSLPAVIGGIVMGSSLWLCNTFVVNQPGGYGQMGLFNAANQWRAAILFIPGMIGQIILPMLSNLNSPDDRQTYLKVLKLNLLINGGSALLIALPIAIAAPYIMNIYGNDFVEGKWILICLSFTTVLISINTIIGQVIASKNQMWFGLLLNMIWAAILITTSLYLVHLGYGAMGLAIANLFAYLLQSILLLIYTYWLLKSSKITSSP